MLKTTTPIALALMLGAAAAPTPDIILVSDSAAVAGCQRLGEVQGGSLWGGAMSGIAYGRALDKIKRKAANLGATHLQLLNATSSMGGSNMLGVAYSCKPSAPAPL